MNRAPGFANAYSTNSRTASARAGWPLHLALECGLGVLAPPVAAGVAAGKRSFAAFLLDQDDVDRNAVSAGPCRARPVAPVADEVALGAAHRVHTPASSKKFLRV